MSKSFSLLSFSPKETAIVKFIAGYSSVLKSNFIRQAGFARSINWNWCIYATDWMMKYGRWWSAFCPVARKFFAPLAGFILLLVR